VSNLAKLSQRPSTKRNPQPRGGEKKPTKKISQAFNAVTLSGGSDHRENIGVINKRYERKLKKKNKAEKEVERIIEL
jgi:hypothetical protein